MALNHEFSIFWTYSGQFAALNQDFGCNSWSGATKCPEKICVALSLMSLIGYHVGPRCQHTIIVVSFVQVIQNFKMSGLMLDSKSKKEVYIILSVEVHDTMCKILIFQCVFFYSYKSHFKVTFIQVTGIVSTHCMSHSFQWLS